MEELIPGEDQAIETAQELPPALFKIPHNVLSAAITASGLPAAQWAFRTLFADGVAAREMRIPAGTIATARKHLRSHIVIFVQGEMTIWEEGKEERVILAPDIWVAPEGAQYAGYAHADSIWVTIFPNPDGITDPDVLLDLNEALPPDLLPGTVIPPLREILP